MKFKKAFKQLIECERPEILPQFEWGYWPETLERWHKEGLPENVEPWDALGITYYYRLPVETRIFPRFEEKILEDKGECLIVQDPDGIIKALAHFRKMRNDVILFHVLDQTELDLSFNRPAEFIDLETNEKLMVDPRGIAPSYREAMKAFLDKYQDACNKMKIDYRLVNTKQEPETFLKAYLEERQRCS